MSEKPERDLQGERDHAEFAGWAQAQGYDDSERYDFDELAEAFAAGIESERQPAKPGTVVIVTTETGREIRYRAAGFACDTNGLAVGELREVADDDPRQILVRPVGMHANGCWREVRVDGTTEPDDQAKALGVARRALGEAWREICSAQAQEGDLGKIVNGALDELFNLGFE